MLQPDAVREGFVLLFHCVLYDLLQPIWVQLPCARNGVRLWPMFVMYGSWVRSPWPPRAFVVRAFFWTSPMYEGLRARLLRRGVTPNIEKADGGHISVKFGDSY